MSFHRDFSVTPKKISMRRRRGTFNWTVSAEFGLDFRDLLNYAVNVAECWLERELIEKRRVTANLLNKACGILAEEILSAELMELNIPHVRTVPLLSKNHPVNAGKPYDILLNGVKIDIKAISPLPAPKFGHHSNLNVNGPELGKNFENKCDIYVGAKCYPELKAELIPTGPVKSLKPWVSSIMKKICLVEFFGFAYADEIIRGLRGD
jgi:hypothetical protein